jgi:thiol-disulfide isomerase/thioredoxin
MRALLLALLLLALAPALVRAASLEGLGADAAQARQALGGHVLRTPDGDRLPLASLRGEVVVVNFWASWCAPCREEIPEFISFQDKFRDKGLVFIGIAVDQKERAAAFSKEMGINYPVLVGDMKAMQIAGAAGNIQGALPFTVVIDRNGKMVGSKLGRLSESKLESMIGPLL